MSSPPKAALAFALSRLKGGFSNRLAVNWRHPVRPRLLPTTLAQHFAPAVILEICPRHLAKRAAPSHARRAFRKSLGMPPIFRLRGIAWRSEVSIGALRGL